jgi:hypothetical protein
VEFSSSQGTKPLQKIIKQQVAVMLKNALTLPVRWNDLLSADTFKYPV